MRDDALVETREAAAGSGFCILRFLSSQPIVDHLSADGFIFTDESDEAVPRAAVPDHIGHPLAHRPGEYSIRERFQLPGSVFNLACDPCRREHLPGTIQFALKPGLSIPGDGHSHLAQSLTRHALDFAHLLHCPRKVPARGTPLLPLPAGNTIDQRLQSMVGVPLAGTLLDETPCQFALERNHGQGMPKQIMEVAC